MKRKTTYLLALLGGLASMTGDARGDVMAYAVDTARDLVSVDLTTATASVIGSLGPVGLPEGLAISPGGALFMTNDGGTLYSVSATTGTATAIGSTGLGDVEGLAFNGGTLLATDFVLGATSVYTIDPTTGAATLLVTTNPGEGIARALALMNPTTALIAAGSAGSESLVSINLTTGATSVLGAIQSSDFVAAMATGPGGILYGLTGAGNEVIINPDGSTTLVGNTGGQFYLDMAIIPGVAPEPSSLALLGVAGVVGLGARLRRRARG